MIKWQALGLNLQTVGLTMQTAFNGNTDGKFRAGEYEYDINIRFNEYDRSNINDVNNLIFVNNMGQQIKLSQFAEVIESSGPSMLERRDKSTWLRLKRNLLEDHLVPIATEWESVFSKWNVQQS